MGKVYVKYISLLSRSSYSIDVLGLNLIIMDHCPQKTILN